MIRMSVSEMTTFRWSFEQDVAQYRKAAFSALGVWRQKVSDFGEKSAIELVKQTGLAVSSLAWAGGFTGSDGRSHPESVRDGYEALHLAEAIKAPCLITHTGPRGGHTSNHARRLACQALGSLLPVAEELNIFLGLEPMHEACAGEWTFLTSLDQALELMRELGSSHVKLVFDVYHMGHDPRNVAQLADLIPHVALVQLGDAAVRPAGEQNRCPLGDGILPLESVVRTLVDGGYDGYGEVELLGEDVEWLAYEDLLQTSRSWLTDVVPADVSRIEQ